MPQCDEDYIAVSCIFFTDRHCHYYYYITLIIFKVRRRPTTCNTCRWKSNNNCKVHCRFLKRKWKRLTKYIWHICTHHKMEHLQAPRPRDRKPFVMVPAVQIHVHTSMMQLHHYLVFRRWMWLCCVLGRQENCIFVLKLKEEKKRERKINYFIIYHTRM